jgi:hypothetical protein
VSACGRFESEGFLKWELGQAPDAHVLSCPECLARWRALERLGPALRQEPPVKPLPPQWKARVLAAAGEPSSPRRRWSRAVWLTPVLAAASIALVLTVVRRGDRTDDLGRPTLDFALVAADSRRTRGHESGEPTVPTAAVGDRLKLFGAAPAGGHFEVRVYRNGGELVFRCPPGCRVDGGRFEVDVPLQAPGRYEAFAAMSRKELPPPAPGKAEDAARIGRAGGRVLEVPAIEVK